MFVLHSMEICLRFVWPSGIFGTEARVADERPRYCHSLWPGVLSTVFGLECELFRLGEFKASSARLTSRRHAFSPQP